MWPLILGNIQYFIDQLHLQNIAHLIRVASASVAENDSANVLEWHTGDQRTKPDIIAVVLHDADSAICFECVELVGEIGLIFIFFWSVIWVVYGTGGHEVIVNVFGLLFCITKSRLACRAPFVWRTLLQEELDVLRQHCLSSSCVVDDCTLKDAGTPAPSS